MIQPVITAVPTPVVGQGRSTGAIAGNALIAATAALAAGDYMVEISMGFADTLAAGKALSCQLRNAADSATQAELGLCPAGTNFVQVYKRVTVGAGEKIRVVNLAVAAAAASELSATIRAHLLDPKGQQ